MRILLIVPDGVGVRNYLYSGFVDELEKQGVIIMLYYQISDTAIAEVQSVRKNIALLKKIPFFVEQTKPRILRESTAYARLLRSARLLKNSSTMVFWMPGRKNLRQRLLYYVAERLGTWFSSSYPKILKYEQIYEKEIANSPVIKNIEADFDEFKPDLVLNLHQRSPIGAPIIEVAKKRKIKTATVIFSWDNLPKSRLVSRYDLYLVWSDMMQKELELLYPEIDPDTIRVVGSPQFEFYFDETLLESKHAFFNRYGLDPEKSTVCFSSNDSTSPYEADYLKDVCAEIEKIDAQNRPQILFRVCPVDRSDRFDAVLEHYKGLVFPIAPDWATEISGNSAFANIFPKYNDLSLLANTVRHSDVVINLGSTMAHDFAVYDKPCLYLKYDPVVHSTYPVALCYQLPHFKSMEGLEPVGWIEAKSQIGPKTLQAIRHPQTIGKDRKEWMQRIIRHPLQDSSKNIVAELIAAKRNVK